MKRFALLALPLTLVACGDNNDENKIDATPADSQTVDVADIDAPTDAAIDATVDAIDAPPALTYSGTISILEAAVLNPGVGATTFFGQGVQIGVGFSSSNTAIFPAPIMEETPGSPIGCKAWRYNATESVAVTLGLDEGPVTWAVTGTGAPPAYPTCNFTAGLGYTCPHGATAGVGGVVAAGPAPGTATLTVTGTPYNAGNTTNRYVNISGATNAANNGTFPIVALAAATTIVYGNPAVVAETLPGTSTHVNLAGIGPTPGQADPGFLPDDNLAAITHTVGTGGGHIPDFVTMGTPNVGDDFVLAPSSLALMNNIPRANAAFTIACETGMCGAATGMLINIVTTDRSVAGQSPFSLPQPVTERLQIRCAQLGATSVTIPAAYAALLNTAGITRIQTTVVRPTLMASTPALPSVNQIAGHSITGFTTVP
jgi:hypothetical protein